MRAYRLQLKGEVAKDVEEVLYDEVDVDCFSKKEYIEEAKKLTKYTNKELNTNYVWSDLFEEPTDIGWRYCKYCDTFYWADNGCECD